MRTVLVVDDEFGVAEVLQWMLEDEGYRVLTAINGKQGLVRMAEVPPDLIFLDCMMPIMDGPQMLRAIRANPAYADIPVVMMSSLGERVVGQMTRDYVAFLLKPFRAADVVALARRLVPPDS